MFLESTPYIKLRKARGLINIDYTACDIIGLETEGPAAARSYNTIIGVYTRSGTGEKIYLETAGSYSTTTAAKHKPRAARLAAHNGYKIITDIKPQVLHDIYFYNKYNVDEILKESQIHAAAIAAIKTGNSPETVRDIKPYLKTAYKRTRKDFKNGNHQTRSWYKLQFKYHAPIYYHINTHVFKETRPAYYGRTGYKPPATYNKYKQGVFFS